MKLKQIPTRKRIQTKFNIKNWHMQVEFFLETEHENIKDAVKNQNPNLKKQNMKPKTNAKIVERKRERLP